MGNVQDSIFQTNDYDTGSLTCGIGELGSWYRLRSNDTGSLNYEPGAREKLTGFEC